MCSQLSKLKKGTFYFDEKKSRSLFQPYHNKETNSNSHRSSSSSSSPISNHSTLTSMNNIGLSNISKALLTTAVRLDPLVNISPTVPQNVFMPPSSQNYQPNESSFFIAKTTNSPSTEFDPESICICQTQSSINQHTNETNKDFKGVCSICSAPLVSYCCNVHVNLKEVGLIDSDMYMLTSLLNEKLHMKGNPFFHSSNQKVNNVKSEKMKNDIHAESYSNKSHHGNTVYFIALDLSENNLSCSGIETLAKWFIENKQYMRLRILKVYKNFISDIGAKSLAELISKQCSPLEELHLSHNRITGVGALALFDSIACAHSFSIVNSKKVEFMLYPRPDVSRSEFLPVWIRLEYNNISEASRILRQWEAIIKSHRKTEGSLKLVCFADRANHPHGSKDPHCSPARCLRSFRGHSPLLHLYSFYHQCLNMQGSSLRYTKNASNSFITRQSISPNKMKSDTSHRKVVQSLFPSLLDIHTTRDHKKKQSTASQVQSTVSKKNRNNSKHNEKRMHIKHYSQFLDEKSNSILSTDHVRESNMSDPQSKENLNRFNVDSKNQLAVDVEVVECDRRVKDDDYYINQTHYNDPMSTSYESLKCQGNSIHDTFDCSLQSNSNENKDTYNLSSEDTIYKSSSSYIQKDLMHNDNSMKQLQHFFNSSNATQYDMNLNKSIKDDILGKSDFESNTLVNPTKNSYQENQVTTDYLLSSKMPQCKPFNEFITPNSGSLKSKNANSLYSLSNQGKKNTDMQNEFQFKWNSKKTDKLKLNLYKSNYNLNCSEVNSSSNPAPDDTSNAADLCLKHRIQSIRSENIPQSELTKCLNSLCHCCESQFDQNKECHTNHSMHQGKSNINPLYESSNVYDSHLHANANNNSTNSKFDQCFSLSPSNLIDKADLEPSYSNKLTNYYDSKERTSFMKNRTLSYNCPYMASENPNERLKSSHSTNVCTNNSVKTCEHSPVLPQNIPPSKAIPQSLSPSCNVPLYIFLDSSAFAEMRKLWKNNKVNIFSFPGMYSLYQKKVLCHSLMEPYSRTIQYNTSDNNSSNMKDSTQTVVEVLDSNQGLVLMVVNSVEEGLLMMTESQPSFRKVLVDLQKNFITPLTLYGVVETIDGLGDSSTSPGWMILDKTTCDKATDLEASSDALRVIDFACVWSHHLSQVSSTHHQSNATMQNSNQLNRQSDSDIKHSHQPFSLFVTCSNQVETFFSYLVTRQKDVVLNSSNENNNDILTKDYLGNLLCIQLDDFNDILRDAFPLLAKMLTLPNAFVPCEKPFLDGQEILSACNVRDLIRNHLKSSNLFLNTKSLLLALSNCIEPHLHKDYIHEKDSLKKNKDNADISFGTHLLNNLDSSQNPSNQFSNNHEKRSVYKNKTENNTWKDGYSSPNSGLERELYDLRQYNLYLRDGIQRALALVSDCLEKRLEAKKISNRQNLMLNDSFIMRCEKECFYLHKLLSVSIDSLSYPLFKQNGLEINELQNEKSELRFHDRPIHLTDCMKKYPESYRQN